jgi:type IV pilus assembly protein PilB
LLIEDGHISSEDLQKGLERQKESGRELVEVLIEMECIDRGAFQQIMAKQPGVASIDLENYTVPPELATIVPREIAEHHQIYPIDKLRKLLTLAMACPLDTKTIEELIERTGFCVKPILCSHKDIQDCIDEIYVDDKTG